MQIIFILSLQLSMLQIDTKDIKCMTTQQRKTLNYVKCGACNANSDKKERKGIQFIGCVQIQADWRRQPFHSTVEGCGRKRAPPTLHIILWETVSSNKCVSKLILTFVTRVRVPLGRSGRSSSESRPLPKLSMEWEEMVWQSSSKE